MDPRPMPATLVAFALRHKLGLRRTTFADGSQVYSVVRDGREIAFTASRRPTVANALAMMRRALATFPR